MKTHVLPALAALIFVASGAAVAQMDHSTHGAAMAQSAAAATAVAKADSNPNPMAMGEGVVKKINKARGTVTLAHDALPNGMPAMTMAYKVKDPAMLEQLQAGQKIRFATDPADGGMTVTRFETIKP